MTTFQEPPASSRRATRNGERGELSNPVTTGADFGSRPAGYPRQNYASYNEIAPSYQTPSYDAQSYQDQSYQDQPAPSGSYGTPAYQDSSYQPGSYGAPSYPTGSYETPSYPAGSYATASYQEPRYPASGNPADFYPPSYGSAQPYDAQQYQTQQYQTQQYQAQQYQAQQSYGSPSYQPYLPPAFSGQQSYQPGQSAQPYQPYLPPYTPPQPGNYDYSQQPGYYPADYYPAEFGANPQGQYYDYSTQQGYSGQSYAGQSYAGQNYSGQSYSGQPGEPAAQGSFAATTGHWSRQAAIDDVEQPFAAMLTREIGRGATTTATNALILPATKASPNDFAAAINSTGEIFVTGSLTMPGSVARIAHEKRRLDHPDVDTLFDGSDRELISTNSAPIRAIRSVSSQTATHGIIRANKPHGSRMLVTLIVAASLMAVGVAGLLVAGFVFNIF